YNPRPVGKARRDWIDPQLKRKHRARWGTLQWVERTLRARKDAAILAMADDGLKWRQIQEMTGLSESEVGRPPRRARAARAPSPEGQPGAPSPEGQPGAPSPEGQPGAPSPEGQPG